MGMIFVILASALFGSYPTIQGAVMESGASPLGMVIVCNSVAGISSLIVGLMKRENFKIPLKTLGALALTGVFGLYLTDYLLNVSYTLIPVGFTTMIHFFYPALVTMLMVILFRERFTWYKLAAIIVSILGLLLLSGGDFTGNKLGILTALMTAFAYAFYMITNDKTQVGTVPLMARSFYMNVFVVIAAFCTNGISHTAIYPTGAINISLSILVGVLLCIATVLLNAGIARLGAAKTSFINMLEPVISLVVSTLVFHYALTKTSIAGVCLILLSLVLITAVPMITERANKT
ncbi:MAG: DMT family transporter [Eubacterium sp.]|nr:DMT family transporter [Eubacterium sp.]